MKQEYSFLAGWVDDMKNKAERTLIEKDNEIMIMKDERLQERMILNQLNERIEALNEILL